MVSTERELGILTTRLDAQDTAYMALKSDVSEIKKDVKDIRDALAGVRSGTKMLITMISLAGAAGAAGAKAVGLFIVTKGP